MSSVFVFCPAGKILVDVSNNRRVNQYPESNAEYLASLLPDSIVVKGFNVISAWTLQQRCAKDANTQVQSNIFLFFKKRDFLELSQPSTKHMVNCSVKMTQLSSTYFNYRPKNMYFGNESSQIFSAHPLPP